MQALPEELATFLGSQRLAVDARLAALLPDRGESPAILHEAMRYALESPGKRIRPILTLAVAQMFKLGAEEILDPACAMELLHACSLILDDLPCMDDAETRRGLAATHRVYGEDIAILAAVALMNLAFAILARGPAGANATARRGSWSRADLVYRTSLAIGSGGVIGGQALDLRAGRAGMDFETLEFIHSHKTGALFIAAAEMGALAGGAPPRQLSAISQYAKNLGLAFQITDDMLDARGDTAALGKPVGRDSDKVTFVNFLGYAGARQLVAELTDFAVAALAPFGKRAHLLRQLAEHVRDRES